MFTKPQQQLLGIARPDPGKPSKWRGPRELPFVARRREAAHRKRIALSSAPRAANPETADGSAVRAVILPKLGKMK